MVNVDRKGRKPRVLFLTSWYPDRFNNLGGIFVKRHAESIHKTCELFVLYLTTVEYSRINKNRVMEYEPDNGIKTLRVYIRQSRFKAPLFQKFLNGVKYLRAFFLCLKYIKNKHISPDFIHLNVLWPFGILALAQKLLKGTPFVITEHWSGYMPGDNRYSTRCLLGKFVTRAIAANSRGIITVSSALRSAMQNRGLRGRYFVVPNAIDTEIFFCRRDRCQAFKTKKIVHVSLLVDRDKNVSGLIRAVKYLSGKRDDFCLYILGGGPDRVRLEQLSRGLKLEDRFIVFCGTKSPEDVAGFMRQADFFVSNSNYESFSVACIEALSSGIPVLSTRCGGPEEYISPEVGMLVEPQNEILLCRALEYMLDNCANYQPQKLHEYARNLFSFHSVSRKLLDVYQELFTGGIDFKNEIYAN